MTEARRALDEGALSPLELIESCLTRIEATEPVLKAWVKVDAERAMGRAVELEHSADHRAGSGPLWGIPLGVKDIIDVEGLPTTASSKVLAHSTPAESDAPIVSRLRAGGSVILGKTNTQEFAYGAVTAPTKNPWDTSRIPGGSSGGSAVAVASAQCPAALGSDTAGSIRIPSALCGITGLKPRPGIIPLEGVIPLSPTFDTLGPMAFGAEDLALIWSAMTEEKLPSPSTCRIAVPHRDELGDLDTEVASAFDQAVSVLAGISGGTFDAKIPPLDDYSVPRSLVLMSEALETHRSRGWWPEHRDLYSEETRSYLDFAETHFRTGHNPGFFDWDAYAGYQSSVTALKELSERFRSFLDVAEVMALPTLPIAAPTHEEASVAAEGSPRRPVVLDLTRIPGPVNVAGLAALSIPCGFTSEGLPIGIQLVGEDEWVLIHLAIAFQSETDWVRRPPI